MRTNNQYALNAFRRVQAFLDEHADTVGALRDSEARKVLDAAVAQLEAHGMNQSTSVLEIDGHLNLQRSLEIDLRKGHMQPIANFARAKLRGVPDYAALTRGVTELKGHSLVRAARAMATAAAPHAESLTRNAFPADALVQLGKAAEQVEAAIDGRANLNVRKAGATKGISEETKQASDAVKMLSAVIDRQFAKDRTFLAAWRAAKRVVAKPGVARGSTVGPAPVAVSA